MLRTICSSWRNLVDGDSSFWTCLNIRIAETNPLKHITLFARLARL